ncbi:MAG: hypothetical protein LBR71_01575 [Synergistaceae bacterium]|jgi:hypothetical protein|nr:hypothetical protein [Synergistaceae bacterium]
MMERTEELMRIADLDTGARVVFHLNPEVFQDDKTTEFASIGIPGMSHPRIQYTGGGERTLSFSAFIHSGVTEDVPATIRLLQSWQYAEYQSGRLTKAPHRLLIIFGEAWPDEQWVLRSCSVTRRRFDKQLKCVFAEISVEFVQIVEESVDFKEVRGW